MRGSRGGKLGRYRGVNCRFRAGRQTDHFRSHPRAKSPERFAVGLLPIAFCRADLLFPNPFVR